MNLIYGEVIRVFEEAGLRMGKIRIGGAMKDVALELVENPAKGDVVLLCDGIAISKMREETHYVSGDSW
jgi:hydrogenase maturation factor